MNNSQDNFNLNNQLPENENIENSKQHNEVLNVIPTGTPLNSGNHDHDEAFIKNLNDNPNNGIEEVNKYLNRQPNRFINENIDTTANNLNNLNVQPENTAAPKVDYSKDPKVMENMNKKNTVSITAEGKIFIIIILVLLLFIFVLPTVFEYIRNIQYQ